LSIEYELTYAHTVKEGAELAERISGLAIGGGKRELGFDTEFYGVELGRFSVLGRAKVHFASLAWYEGGEKLHPRGFTVPRAAVVSREVVTECAEFRGLFQKDGFTFYAHNAPVDAHTFKNEGIEIRDIRNTLTMARWCWPSRARATWGGSGFGLDALGKDVLGEGKLESFSELFRETREEIKHREKLVKWCACGIPGCRKRTKPEHDKYTRSESLQEVKLIEVPVPLEVVVPGHVLFPRAVRYAAQDAVLALALVQVINRELKKQIRVIPWNVPVLGRGL